MLFYLVFAVSGKTFLFFVICWILFSFFLLMNRIAAFFNWKFLLCFANLLVIVQIRHHTMCHNDYRTQCTSNWSFANLISSQCFFSVSVVCIVSLSFRMYLFDTKSEQIYTQLTIVEIQHTKQTNKKKLHGKMTMVTTTVAATAAAAVAAAASSSTATTTTATNDYKQIQFKKKNTHRNVLHGKFIWNT